MSKHLPQTLSTAALGLSVASVLIPMTAHSQAKPAKTEANAAKIGGIALPDPNQINKKIQKDYPPELLEDGNPNDAPTGVPKNSTIAIPNAASTSSDKTIALPKASSSNGIVRSESVHTSAVSSSNYTFVLSTPLLIAILVVVGGLALFPIVHVLLNSKKILELQRNSPLAKLFDRFQKPRVLESDEFLHQREFDRLTSIANQAENMNADKFANSEFTAFIKIKSYIARSMGEYAGLDNIIEMLTAAIGAQNSFLVIEGSESRHCSSNQQQLYKFVNTLLNQEIDPEDFKNQVEQKSAEVMPLLKTEEGKVALQAYTIEMGKVSQHPLGLKLLLLFKKYQFDDFSTLRSVNTTISQVGNEDLLNLDGLLLLIMEKYDVFEKLGPIIGVAEENNRPETYAKMLQYIGLKDRHEVAYEKFQELLKLMKKWGVYHQTVMNVRQKYNSTEYRLPKNFTVPMPAIELYNKYKDSLSMIADKPPASSTPAISTPSKLVVNNIESAALVGTK